LIQIWTNKKTCTDSRPLKMNIDGCLIQVRTWLSTFDDLKWGVVVRFIDIGEMVDHHYLDFLFIIEFTNFNTWTRAVIILLMNMTAKSCQFCDIWCMLNIVS
jgi:hypothetical protein